MANEKHTAEANAADQKIRTANETSTEKSGELAEGKLEFVAGGAAVDDRR